ncbi:MAG: hypothetical protein HC895_03430 [Leptolyngbyaceae cyanobacterium SM1_3_5]|nr:hypothetical protein [Leptolyngbyaceae cyanobacterium SM1_3_5]
MRLDHLQKKLDAIPKRAASNSDELEDWRQSQVSLIQNELASEVQSNVDRLQSDLNSEVGNLLARFVRDWESEVDTMKTERSKRIKGMIVMSVIIGISVGLIYVFGINQTLPNNAFVVLLFSVIGNFISGSITYVIFKLTDRFPRNIRTKESLLLNRFQAEHTKLIDGAAENLEKLANPNYQLISSFWHSILLDKPLKLRAVENEENYQNFRNLVQEYSSLRQEYSSTILRATSSVSKYFSDTEGNLQRLNEFLGQLQETSIKPSFDLLAETQEKLETVIQNTQLIDFT